MKRPEFIPEGATAHTRRAMATICVSGLPATFINWALPSQDAQRVPTIHEAAASDTLPDRHHITIPTLDISGDSDPEDLKRHVVLAAGNEKENWQHPHMLLMPDGKTIFAVWTLGHGGACGPIKRSDDGGSTWSKPLTVPENWTSAKNCPAIHRLADPRGTVRLIVFARANDGSFVRSVSEDDGRTWSPMRPAGFSGVVPPMTVLPVVSGKKLLTWTHTSKTLQVLQSESLDGGLTWSAQTEPIDKVQFPNSFPCEPEVIRSPNGKQLLMLMRENNRRYNSFYALSNDEGRTWSKPKELPAALTGDRHTAVYAKDGRLVVMFRNRRPVPRNEANHDKAGIPVWGSGKTTAWVGRYEDIVEGREGQYLVSLLGYGGYGKLERLPDGTILGITYCVYQPRKPNASAAPPQISLDEQIRQQPGEVGASIVTTRFTLEELDGRLRTLGARRDEPLPDKLPKQARPLGEVPQAGVAFRTGDRFLQRLYDAAESVCRGNIVHYPPPFDMDILIEGSGYIGAWLETQPMGGRMWGKRDLRVARNNQMIFLLNQASNGQLAYRVNTDQRRFGSLQGYCFPTPAWELYFLLNKDKEYLRRLYVGLEGHDRFLWATRDTDFNGCLEAFSSGDAGEDGSSRWPEDRGKLPAFYESMDVMSYAYDGETILGKIAAELGNGQADSWRAKAESTRRKLIEYLWRPEKHACYDRGPDNKFMDVLIHNNLRCMYHGIFTQQMADAFVRHHLLNPAEFWTPMPLVSIAANDPKFKSVSHNNWSGQPQGLTFQRAIRALENYGHYAELTLIGRKLLAAAGKDLIFTQQFDPWTGEPNPPRGGRTSSYGPTALSVLEYIAHLHGVELVLDRNQVWFSGLARGEHDHEYTQNWNGREFSLRLKQGRFDGLVDGRKAFTCSANVRVITDLSGRPVRIVGISPEPQKVAIEWGSSRQTLTVRPNQNYALITNRGTVGTANKSLKMGGTNAARR